MDSPTKNIRSKNETRESRHSNLGRSNSCRDVCGLYQMSLERRVARGDLDLVCRDEELCQSVEQILKGGNHLDLLAALGLDTLAVIEDSLLLPPKWGPTVGGHTEPRTAPCLGTISRAFEVLEQAALNLYLCPWRKEYRVVKIFSGMFTHLVRPAMSEMQAQVLFRLLGYELKGAELELRGAPPAASTLLSLACAFFVARCESRLLSMAAATSGAGMGAELSLVQDRRKGCSLEAALESLLKKVAMEWEGQVELDLYTADGEGHMEETSVTSPGKEKQSAASVCRSASLRPEGGSSFSNKMHITLTSAASLPFSPTAEDRRVATGPKQNRTCTCALDPCPRKFSKCQQCGDMHFLTCKIRESCLENHHKLTLTDVVSSKKAKHTDQPLRNSGSVTVVHRQQKEVRDTTYAKDGSEGEASAKSWTEPGVGSASNAKWHTSIGGPSTPYPKEPKVAGGSAAATYGANEVTASAAQMGKTLNGGPSGSQGQARLCSKLDCQQVYHAFCRFCSYRLCQQCWCESPMRCPCGEYLSVPTSE